MHYPSTKGSGFAMEKTPMAKLLLKLSPPVMFALLIQAVYNIVDSYFVAKYSAAGLTALSIIFPLQLLMTAVATGTGSGLGILLSKMDGEGKSGEQGGLLSSGLFLGAANYAAFTVLGLPLLQWYFRISSGRPEVQSQGCLYAAIILAGSFGQFMEGICTKILQAKGNMVLPMLAQVAGAVINVILDPLLIFGMAFFPELGIAGAAIATVAGQLAAMLITLRVVRRRFPPGGKVSAAACLAIYRSGLPSIVMQSLYTLYIVGLNLILKPFTEDAVTVLGIYYKLQTFFFIPLMGLQQVILPVVSYNYGAGNQERLKELLRDTLLFAFSLMLPATVLFMAFPAELLSVFSREEGILEIGAYALRVISASFLPAGVVMVLTVYFQGVGRGKQSLTLTVLRQVCLLVPLAWLFHYAGLDFVWYTFPVTEFLTMAVGIVLYREIGKI